MTYSAIRFRTTEQKNKKTDDKLSKPPFLSVLPCPPISGFKRLNTVSLSNGGGFYFFISSHTTNDYKDFSAASDGYDK